MSSIEELQKRVLEAEARFGLINERRSKYSDRLVGLIDAVEKRLREQTAAVERQTAELTSQTELSRHATEENQSLRVMLHSLLRAIEAGSRDVLTDTMQAMDAKVSTLIAETHAPEPILGLTTRRPAADKTFALVAPVADAAIEAEDMGELEVDEPEAPPAPSEVTEVPSEVAPEEVLEMAPEATQEEDSEAAPEEDSEGSLAPEIEAEVEVEVEVEAEVEAEEIAAAPEPPVHAVGKLSEAQIAELLGPSDVQASAEETETPEPTETAESPEFAAAPDDVQAEPAEDDAEVADQLADPGRDDPDGDEPPHSDLGFESAEPMAVEDEMAAEPAQAASAPDESWLTETPEEPEIPKVPESLETPEPPETLESPEAWAKAEKVAAAIEAGTALEDPETDAAVDDLIQEDEADPDYASIGEPEDDRGEAASLEDIMRRVSRLVEDEGPLGAGSVRIGAGADDQGASDPDDDLRDPVPPKKAASNR